MGKVRRQSTLTTLASYAGAALGFVNKALLFTTFLDPGEVGLANTMANVALFFAQISVLGFSSISLRYFPFFEDKKHGHHGFLGFGVILALIGFTVMSGLFIILRPWVIEYYQEDSPLLVEYYYYIILMAAGFTIHTLLSGYLRSLYKVFVPRLLMEVGLRFLVTVGVTLYIFEVVDLPQFVTVYSFSYFLIGGILIVYTGYLKQLFVSFTDWSRIRQYLKPMLSMGGFALLGGFSLQLVLLVDQLMIGGTNGLGQETLGVYTTAIYIVSMMHFPSKALLSVSSPKIAELWKEQDLKGIGKLYKRVSVLNFAIGLLLFLGIWINLPSLFVIIGRPEYATGIYVVLFVGIARLFDMLTGLNGTILVTSNAYRYDLIFSLTMVVIAFMTNYMLIPRLGMNGAGIATMVTLIFINLARMLFVFGKYKVHPLSLPLLGVFIIGWLAYGATLLVPKIEWIIVDLVVRSLVCTVVFGGLVLGLKLAPDINQFALVLLNDVQRFWKGKGKKN